MEDSLDVIENRFMIFVVFPVFSDVMWLIEQIMWKSLDKRVASFLLEETSIEETNELKITHETIANHLGSFDRGLF